MDNQVTSDTNKKRINKTFRQWIRFLHVMFSLIWMGVVICLGLLIFFRPDPSSGDELRYFNEIIHRIDTTLIAITPLISLITGILLCWKTNWGFFKYWWIIIKLSLTIIIIVFSIIYLGPVSPNLVEISGKLGLEALVDDTYISYFTRLTIFNPINIALFAFLTYVAHFKPWGKRT